MAVRALRGLMAKLRTAKPSDPTRAQANELAPMLGAVIEGQGATINGALTAIAMVTAAIMGRVSEEEFRSTMACFVEAVILNRASAQAPPLQEMN